MTTNNFNAKKVLMSTVAAVVFSFVFTTNSDARPGEYGQKNNIEVRVKTAPNGAQKNNFGVRVKTAPNGDAQKNNLEVRVKTAPNGDRQKNNLEIRVKTAPNSDVQQDQEGFTDMMFRLLQSVFGVRV